MPDQPNPCAPPQQQPVQPVNATPASPPLSQPCPATNAPAPQPAQKPKKPLFKKWWFWAIVVVALIAVIGGVGGNQDGSPDAAPASDQPLTALAASYTGKTEEGTVIEKGTAGLQVVGTFADGTEKPLKDYVVEPPVTLAAGEVSTVNVVAGGLTCTIEVACSTQTPEQYKAGCQPVDYPALARDPEAWKGKNVAVTGEVIQVVESGKTNAYRVSITPSEYGFWTDPIYVTYKQDLSANRILEDDVITIYGEATGLYRYTTILRSEETIPSIDAKYIDRAS